ncbi:MAG: AMP-binding protein [Magnetospirillum sp.]|nr:AMP-binding protein [Magnetospirillum sp.]
MNAADWIDRWAAFQADKVAVRCDDEAWSYSDLAARIRRIAHVLDQALGIRHGDRVAWLGLNHPESLALMFACARLGALFMPINWRLTAAEHEQLVADAQPSVILAEPDFATAIDRHGKGFAAFRRACTGGPRPGWMDWDEMVATAPLHAGKGGGQYSDALLLCYTSGTTGQPKGALLSQEAMLWNATNSTHMHDLTSADRILTTLPLFHVGGLNILTVPALHAGATVILQRKFAAAAALATIAAERITLTVLVPTQLDIMMAEPGWATVDLGSLRCITTGSTIVPPRLPQALAQRGVKLIQVYGSTETGPIAAYQRVADADRIGVAGKCAIHCELRIVDPMGDDIPAGTAGEILVKGGNVMSGYWHDKKATDAVLKTGWFYTGDIGLIDEAGYLVIKDRKKDMIISGGENIYPAALEMILCECPDIDEAAVVARPDERWGEVPVAVVVPRSGANLTAEAVLALFEDRIARYKHPRAVLFVDQLPRTSIGKVVKAEVRKMAREMLPQHSTGLEYSR